MKILNKLALLSGGKIGRDKNNQNTLQILKRTFQQYQRGLFHARHFSIHEEASANQATQM
jgi:hypothetical protein